MQKMPETQDLFDPWVVKIPRVGNGNPLQYSCLENPMDRAAWRATVHGAAESWTRLRDGALSKKCGPAGRDLQWNTGRSVKFEIQINNTQL